MAKSELNIKNGANLSRRNVATSRVAAMLGLGKIVANSRIGNIKLNSELISGNNMDEAKDTRSSELKNCKYTKEAIDQLMSLHFLDLICGQVDRKYGIYTHVTDNGQVTDVIAIDNDLSFGETTYEQLLRMKLYKGLNANNIALFPPELIDKLKDLKPEKIRLALMDLLSNDEIEYFCTRITKVQELINNYNQMLDTQVNETERMILRDRDLGPLWTLYTYRCKAGNRVDGGDMG